MDMVMPRMRERWHRHQRENYSRSEKFDHQTLPKVTGIKPPPEAAFPGRPVVPISILGGPFRGSEWPGAPPIRIPRQAAQVNCD
jgi:hypothetical protein